MSKFSRSLAAGTVAGTATAAVTPGALGVVGAEVAMAIPVVGQILAVGTVAALAVAALTDDTPAASSPAGITQRFQRAAALASSVGMTPKQKIAWSHCCTTFQRCERYNDSYYWNELDSCLDSFYLA